MKKVCKTTDYKFGWSDPRSMFSDVPTYKKPLLTYKRLVGDSETGMIGEYTNAYIHGVEDRCQYHVANY